MMFVAVGISNLVIGLAYVGLGLLSAWEAISLHRYRGWSRFGLGFSMMAASCGPHHLVHGWHVLQGGDVSVAMLTATLIGLPAGLIFVLLRLEAMRGGQGERLIGASAQQMALLASALTVVAGVLATSALAQPAADFSFETLCESAGPTSRDFVSRPEIKFLSAGFFANMFVTITYGMVGWYLAHQQVRRFVVAGDWSLSGTALVGVFFTCAQMHLVDATSSGSQVMLFFDLVGVPASVYFLWVVRQLHKDSVTDWNRRPLVGVAGAPARPSPWVGRSTQH